MSDTINITDLEVENVDCDLDTNSDYIELETESGEDVSIGDMESVGFGNEVDPTVPAWAKQPVKPEYEYEEIDDKPSINDVTVQGGKTGYDYHLQNELDFATVHDVERILYTN